MAKFILIAAATGILGLIGIEVYNLNVQRLDLTRRINAVDGQVETLARDNQKLTADLDYFVNPRNLAKEARSLFNYRAPGEKLIILVPKD